MSKTIKNDTYTNECSDMCIYSKKSLFDDNGNRQNPCRLGIHDENFICKCPLLTTSDEIPNNDRVKRTIIKQNKLLLDKIQKNPAESICCLLHLNLSKWQIKVLEILLNKK